MYIFEKIEDENVENVDKKQSSKGSKNYVKEYEKLFEEEWTKQFGDSNEERIMSPEDTLKELKRMANFHVD